MNDLIKFFICVELLCSQFAKFWRYFSLCFSKPVISCKFRREKKEKRTSIFNYLMFLRKDLDITLLYNIFVFPLIFDDFYYFVFHSAKIIWENGVNLFLPFIWSRNLMKYISQHDFSIRATFNRNYCVYLMIWLK